MTAAIIIILSIITTIALALGRMDMLKECRLLKESQEKTESYFIPVSQDAIRNYLSDNSMEFNVIDENTVGFTDGDVFIVDTMRLPIIHISVGYQLSNGRFDWDMIKSAAAYVQEELFMVETTVSEGHCVEFHIFCCEMNMGHLKESWQYHKSILQHAKEEFIKEYNRRHDMDRNEFHMKIYSPDVQLERMANQLIAKVTDEAQRDTTNDATPANRVS